mmetsp:Transcript_24113/g.58655  ORF Transcript_24113/g.58655 Transcript_24113/m.58655 type:complete len:201 (+) Transcript_24113:398-1000(+)
MHSAINGNLGAQNNASGALQQTLVVLPSFHKLKLLGSRLASQENARFSVPQRHLAAKFGESLEYLVRRRSRCFEPRITDSTDYHRLLGDSFQNLDNFILTFLGAILVQIQAVQNLLRALGTLRDHQQPHPGLARHDWLGPNRRRQVNVAAGGDPVPSCFDVHCDLRLFGFQGRPLHPSYERSKALIRFSFPLSIFHTPVG